MSFAAHAQAAFEAIEAGKGWSAVAAHFAPGATFSCEALADVKTAEAYADWMKGLYTWMPDARYTLHSATLSATSAAYFATFHGSHTGQGGPCPPTQKSMNSDYVYVFFADADGKIARMSKIWNAPAAFKQLGWSA